MTDETVTRAGKGRRLQARKVRKDGFSAAKRQVYLDTLAMCCTVSASAAAAGVSVTTILYHRHRDPVFAQQEYEALESGYFALEAASVAHAARGGHYAPGDGADPGTPGAEALEPSTAMRLLALRRRGIGQRTGNGGRRPQRVSERELNESILAKLAILGRRRALRRGSGQALKKHEARKLKTVAQARAAMGKGTAPRNRPRSEGVGKGTVAINCPRP
jgi:hypothetical protein